MAGAVVVQEHFGLLGDMSDTHVHDDNCRPENCYRAKLRYFRDNGGLSVRFGSGTSPASPGLSSAELFHESTFGEEHRKMKAMNDAAGNSIEKLPDRKELI